MSSNSPKKNQLFPTSIKQTALKKKEGNVDGVVPRLLQEVFLSSSKVKDLSVIYQQVCGYNA